MNQTHSPIHPSIHTYTHIKESINHMMLLPCLGLVPALAHDVPLGAPLAPGLFLCVFFRAHGLWCLRVRGRDSDRPNVAGSTQSQAPSYIHIYTHKTYHGVGPALLLVGVVVARRLVGVVVQAARAFAIDGEMKVVYMCVSLAIEE